MEEKRINGMPEEEIALELKNLRVKFVLWSRRQFMRSTE